MRGARDREGKVGGWERWRGAGVVAGDGEG